MTDTTEEEVADAAIITKLNEAFAAELPALKVPSVTKQTVSIKGEYRVLPLMQGQELFLSSVRRGKRKGVLFICKPVDGQSWDHAEFDEKEFLKLWPGEEKMLCQALGTTASTWSGAKGSFYKTARKAEAAAAVAAHQEMVRENESDPDWGTF